MSADPVLCAANFSEGRDPAVISAIVEAVRGSAGAALWDVESDRDHHRTVVSFAGAGPAVLEGAFAAVRVAVERIDMNRHRGGHIRIGAADVVPFVPLGSAPMARCVELAHRLGERMASELGVPVYLYGEAARLPGRRELPAVRRGQWEGLKEAIGREPERAPDLGPAELHPTAGASAVGARGPIINLNLNLKGGDLEAAGSIAKAVRASSGGLPGVRAKAVALASKGGVQVSTVIVDPSRASVDSVLDAAAAAGAAIAEAEFIGMTPRSAVETVLARGIPLNDFHGEGQILEARMKDLAEDES